ncbi:MAG: methyltransferase domain-containing protein [Deltaproteobacteria bacterium]|nr:MAG: methyltransferase domain-containing protein [Deltaproteobacteria bacterium]
MAPVAERPGLATVYIDRGHHTDLDYHRRMLDDLERVAVYDEAIRRLVRPGDVVLDLGAGTGILSMLAARRGARVHAVESAGVAHLAARLIAANGLSDRITLHHADAVTLDPIEPVDWVIGEFMGRFVIDDEMLDAVAAAGRWLKPAGRFAPHRITMRLAPGGQFRMRMVDRWHQQLLGLDLSAALPLSLNTCYATALPPSALFAEPQTYAVIEPPARPARFDTRLAWKLTRPGSLRAMVGFWTADLCEGVQLSTAPGSVTHWGQYLFPTPPMDLAVGDRLSFRLWLDESRLVWCWEGEATGHPPWRGESLLSPADLPVPQAMPWQPSDEGARSALDEGSQAWDRGDAIGAIRAWQRAAVLVGPESDALATQIYEQLGLANLHVGRPNVAAENLRRALSEHAAPREVLALLVQALNAAYRPGEAQVAQAALDALD